jgi:hypothetical protein
MQNFVEYVEWVLLMLRVRRDPAKFIERAAWHLVLDEGRKYERTGGLLRTAARYVASGQEVPVWLFR